MLVKTPIMSQVALYDRKPMGSTPISSDLALTVGGSDLGDDFKARRDAAMGKNSPAGKSEARLKEIGKSISDLPAKASQRLSEYYESIPATIEGNCSWCFRQRTTHTIFQKAAPLLGRSLYKCKTCCNITVACKKSCGSMARAHQNGSPDANCFKCDGMIKEWDHGVEFNRASTEWQAYCSYCFELTFHALQERKTLARDVYQCQNCMRKTVRCLNCDEGMCHNDGVLYSTTKCSKCLGEIKFWEDVEINRASKQTRGWCSWCIELTTHDFEEASAVGHVDLMRHVYRCQECRARTLKCFECSVGMCQGTELWDDKKCAGCGGVNWEALRELKNVAFNRPRTHQIIKMQLSKPSEYRAKAYENGMLRPFLLLVSMTPRARFQVAASMGWSLIKDLEEFGDAHAEAADILFRSLKGMEGRTENFWETLNPTKEVGKTWYQLLYPSAPAFSKSTPSAT